jgi:hypothetical protein
MWWSGMQHPWSRLAFSSGLTRPTACQTRVRMSTPTLVMSMMQLPALSPSVLHCGCWSQAVQNPSAACPVDHLERLLNCCCHPPAGKPGVSDRLAAALWVIDHSLNIMQVNIKLTTAQFHRVLQQQTLSACRVRSATVLEQTDTVYLSGLTAGQGTWHQLPHQRLLPLQPGLLPWLLWDTHSD